ncbi:MAG: glucan-binding protein [Lachnospiraceae bacterium]
MRKQTKLVAVLSAAALLAIGASMTSFAAGWQKSDDGTWQYYDKDDEMVTGAWQKDGAKWFYLDDDGNMTTDSWVEDEYYVGTDGAMLINTWKKTLASDDVTDPDEDGENWYYFGSKGKKVVDTDKKIGGKTYYFEETGKMRDGWYQDADKVYYLGGEDEGVRASGWLWLEAPEGDKVDVNGHVDDCTACDEEGWYYFGSDGKMYKGANKKKINGKYYFFNNHGQMLYEWINGASVNKGSNAELDGNHKGATPSNMLYANVVEEGWRADGWYQISGASDTGASDDTDWYYFKDGKAKMADTTDITGIDEAKYKYRAKIKVAGKYFCFNEVGQMQTGLQMCNGGFYYFDANGYMKTGKVNEVEEDDDNFTYYFNTKNGNNGRGVTGEKSGYLYWNGKRLDADDDYRIYAVPTDVAGTIREYYLVNKSGKLQKSDKKYKVENVNGEEMTFKFGSNYKITEAKYLNGSVYDLTAEDAVTEPVINIYEDEYSIQ